VRSRLPSTLPRNVAIPKRATAPPAATNTPAGTSHAALSGADDALTLAPTANALVSSASRRVQAPNVADQRTAAPYRVTGSLTGLTSGETSVGKARARKLSLVRHRPVLMGTGTIAEL
jgi:hypothetical protein